MNSVYTESDKKFPILNPKSGSCPTESRHDRNSHRRHTGKRRPTAAGQPHAPRPSEQHRGTRHTGVHGFRHHAPLFTGARRYHSHTPSEVAKSVTFGGDGDLR